jgi:type-F conjugative transfer system pilin assembly thiol-disulfide isomerase TrbB
MMRKTSNRVKNTRPWFQRLTGMMILIACSTFVMSAQADITAGQITALIQKKQQQQLSTNQNQATTNIAQPAVHNAMTQRISSDPIIAALRKDYAVVLFYRSGCPHCQRFDPIVRALTDHYHLTTYAYTTDGRDLPSFPHSLMATQKVLNTFFGGQAIVVPTVFLVNVHTLSTYRIAVGEMSYGAFDQRLHQAANRLVGDSNDV